VQTGAEPKSAPKHGSQTLSPIDPKLQNQPVVKSNSQVPQETKPAENQPPPKPQEEKAKSQPSEPIKVQPPVKAQEEKAKPIEPIKAQPPIKLPEERPKSIISETTQPKPAENSQVQSPPAQPRKLPPGAMGGMGYGIVSADVLKNRLQKNSPNSNSSPELARNVPVNPNPNPSGNPNPNPGAPVKLPMKKAVLPPIDSTRIATKSSASPPTTPTSTSVPAPNLTPTTTSVPPTKKVEEEKAPTKKVEEEKISPPKKKLKKKKYHHQRK